MDGKEEDSTGVWTIGLKKRLVKFLQMNVLTEDIPNVGGEVPVP